MSLRRSPEAPEANPETQFKYAIPYEWGRFYVTQAADQAYGFVPLKEGVVKGAAIDELPQVRAPIVTDITLMTPQELQGLHAGQGILSRPTSRPNGLCSASITKDSIKLYLALHQDTSTTQNEILGDLKEIVEQHGGNIEDVVTQSGVPATESLESAASQFLVHTLAEFTGNMVDAAASGTMIESMNRETAKKAAFLGGGAAAGSVGVIGASLLSKGEVDALSLGTSAFYLTSLLGLSYASLRNNFRSYTDHSFMLKIGGAAAMFANAISDDIHATYCTAHFDQQIGGEVTSEDDDRF